MKAGIHPQLHPVMYVDGDHHWFGMSTTKTNQTKEVDGITYYVVNVDISAFTHPFYTGQKKLVDTAGRVEKFMRKYGMKDQDNK